MNDNIKEKLNLIGMDRYRAALQGLENRGLPPDMYNYKLADIAHELDKVNLEELTPIDALNVLVKIKEKIK